MFILHVDHGYVDFTQFMLTLFTGFNDCCQMLKFLLFCCAFFESSCGDLMTFSHRLGGRAGEDTNHVDNQPPEPGGAGQASG